MSPRERIDPLLGAIRLCRKCQAKGVDDPWWPKDSEFWFFSKGKVLGHCKACWSERQRPPKP